MNILLDAPSYGIRKEFNLPNDYTEFLNLLKEDIFVENKDIIVELFSKTKIEEEFSDFGEISMMLDDEVIDFIPIGKINYEYIGLNIKDNKIYDCWHEVSYLEWKPLFNSFEEFIKDLRDKKVF